MHDGSHLSYHHLFLSGVAVRKGVREAKRSHLYRLVSTLGKNGETCIYLRMGRRCEASANVPEDLSLSGTSGFQGAGDTTLEVFFCLVVVVLFFLFGLGFSLLILRHTCISCIYCTSVYIIR